MKSLFFFAAIMFCYAAVYGQDLQIPKEVDFGEIDIYTCHDHQAFYSPGKNITIRNASSNTTFLFLEPFFKFSNNYNDSLLWGKYGSLRFRGAYFSSTHGSGKYSKAFYHLDPGDSLIFPIYFCGEFAESNYPKDLTEISGNLILLYRTPDNADIKCDTILLTVKPKRKRQIAFVSFYSDKYYVRHKQIDRPYASDSTLKRFICNLQNSDYLFYIDSVQSYSESCKIQFDTISGQDLKIEGSIFPLLIPNNSKMVQFQYSLSSLDIHNKNILYFKYYCRSQSDDSSFVLHDTASFSFIYYPKVHISQRKDSLRIQVGGKDTSLVSIATYSNNTYYVDSVSFIRESTVIPNELDFYCPWVEFPLLLEPTLGYMNNPLVFSPKQIQDQYGYTVFHIRDLENKTFKRYVLLHTIGLDPVSVEYQDMYSNSVSVYPNPAKNIIRVDGVDGLLGHNVKLVEVETGAEYYPNKITQSQIDISNISSGNYILILSKNGTIFWSKIQVSK